MDKSFHIDIGVLAGIIKYGAVRAKESSEHDAGSDTNPPLNLSPFDCLVAVGKEALRLLASIGGTVLGSLLPDILEPPSTPNHRGLMHSWLANAIAAATSAKLNSSGKPSEGDFIGRLALDFITSLPVGFVSHLLSDATTPRGLPLIL